MTDRAGHDQKVKQLERLKTIKPDMKETRINQKSTKKAQSFTKQQM